MATIADLLTSARYPLHDTDQNKWTGAELIDYINRGYRLIHSRLVQMKSDLARSYTTATTVAGTDYVAIPTGLQSFEFIQVDGEEDPLSQVDMMYIETYNSRISSQRGIPTCFALYNSNIYLRPVPDIAYTLNIYYNAALTDLDSSDTTPFSGIADEALIAFIVEMALARDEHNTSRAQAAVSTLLRMADILFKRRDKSLKRIVAYRWPYEGLV